MLSPSELLCCMWAFVVMTSLLSVHTELISAVEQVVLEEYYEIEIEMHFKWNLPPTLPELPVSESDQHSVDTDAA